MIKVGTIPSFIFPLVLGAFTAVTYVGFVGVYTAQPSPFIDEVFHITQAQKYCQGKFFEWDPKITTLPGLYLFSIGLIGPISWATGRVFCDVFCLRLTNLVAIVFTFATIYKLLNYLHGDKVDGWKLVLYSLNLSIFPVLYWFTFLYYTDVLSSLLVLIMMLLHVHKSPNAAAAMGVVAVFMRQTNIVWVAFLGGLLLVDALGFHILNAPIHTSADLKKCLRRLRKMALKPVILSEAIANITVDCLSYVLVVASFAIFVFINGGLVVGDRESHVPTLHFVQIGYFLLFLLVFSFPYCFTYLKPFLKICKKHTVPALGILLLGVWVVNTNTMVHPFLLSDNRHYMFYVWNRFYGRYAVFRYLMIPFYMFGGYVVHRIIHNRSVAFRLLYCVCAFATFVPQRLLEPRYFILPFLVLRLQSVPRSWLSLCCETVYFIVINLLTLYIFVNKTFKWEDTDQLHRIIW